MNSECCPRIRRAGRGLTAALAIAAATLIVAAQPLDPIAYTLHVAAPDTHYAEIEAAFPTGGAATIETMMPIWSPGYYKVEDYAGKISDVQARTRGGAPLRAEKTRANRWRIDTAGEPAVLVSYRVFCNERSVTTNFVGTDYGVFNGAPTFMTLAEHAARPHEVRIELPAGWTRAMTGLAPAAGGAPNRFRAADYETLVDSPILAGRLDVREFDVAGKKHYIVSAGDLAGWDGDAAVRDLARYVDAVQRFWGFLPYDQYLFLLMFRQGGGGLEHKNSTLSTVAASPPATGMWRGIGLLSHEYFHLFNVKRLRPVELGPFDFETSPTTGSLWIAEGVTSYYSDLLLARAGVRTPDEHLAAMSSAIRQLQNARGRLLQSVEQSSLEVWNNSNSGVNASEATVSYYTKGLVLGLVLDAKIRRATDGRQSLDDVMRLAYRRYSGDRGYTAAEFRATAEELSGVALEDWYRRYVSSPGELDYSDVLDWFGLEFAGGDNTPTWTLRVRGDATDVQRRRLQDWTGR